MPYQSEQSITTEPKEAEVFNVWYLYDLHHNVNINNMHAFYQASYILGRPGPSGTFIPYIDDSGQNITRTLMQNDFFGFIKTAVASGDFTYKLLMDGIVLNTGRMAEEQGLFNLE
mgnify:CR=1 FL=1